MYYQSRKVRSKGYLLSNVSQLHDSVRDPEIHLRLQFMTWKCCVWSLDTGISNTRGAANDDYVSDARTVGQIPVWHENESKGTKKGRPWYRKGSRIMWLPPCPSGLLRKMKKTKKPRVCKEIAWFTISPLGCCKSASIRISPSFTLVCVFPPISLFPFFSIK